MDAQGWQQLQPWRKTRLELPVGPLFCIVTGTTRGRHWAIAAARADLRRTAARAGGRRRFAPHQLRHAHTADSERGCGLSGRAPSHLCGANAPQPLCRPAARFCCSS
jgi:integrase